MKVAPKEKPEKNGPTKEELAEIERIRREQATRDKISRQMNFSGKGNGDGVSGKGEGDGVSGLPTGEQGHDLAGRTIVKWGPNSSRKSGTIRVNVTVNPEGKVIEATYAGGEGNAACEIEPSKLHWQPDSPRSLTATKTKPEQSPGASNSPSATHARGPVGPPRITEVNLRKTITYKKQSETKRDTPKGVPLFISSRTLSQAPVIPDGIEKKNPNLKLILLKKLFLMNYYFQQ